MGIQLSDRVEDIVGKGEIARNEQLLLFPRCFQKQSVVDELKGVVCGKNASGKIAIGKNVRGKIAIGKNVRAKVVKIP